MEKDLEHFKKIQYEIQLRKKGKYFTLFIPNLSILTSDENLEMAYKKLEEDKEDFFKKAIEYGFEDSITETGKKKTAKMPLFGLLPFFVKLGIILLIIVLVGGASYKVASSQIQKSSKLLTEFQRDIQDDLSGVEEKIIGKIALSGFQVIERIKTYPEEKRDKLRGELRKAMVNLKPLIDDFMMLFDYPRTVRLVPDQTGIIAEEPSTQ